MTDGSSAGCAVAEGPAKRSPSAASSSSFESTGLRPPRRLVILYASGSPSLNLDLFPEVGPLVPIRSDLLGGGGPGPRLPVYGQRVDWEGGLVGVRVELDAKQDVLGLDEVSAAEGEGQQARLPAGRLTRHPFR
jgi:hypothetical protein